MTKLTDLPLELLSTILSHLIDESETILNLRLMSHLLRRTVDSNLHFLNKRLEILDWLWTHSDDRLKTLMENDRRIWSLYLDEKDMERNESYASTVLRAYSALKDFLQRDINKDTLKTVSDNLLNARILTYDTSCRKNLYAKTSYLEELAKHEFAALEFLRENLAFINSEASIVSKTKKLPSILFCKRFEKMVKIATKHESSTLLALKDPSFTQVLFSALDNRLPILLKEQPAALLSVISDTTIIKNCSTRAIQILFSGASDEVIFSMFQNQEWIERIASIEYPERRRRIFVCGIAKRLNLPQIHSESSIAECLPKIVAEITRRQMEGVNIRP